MRDAPSREKAEQRREAIVERYQHEFPELCRCLLDDADASLNHLEVPQRHQQYVRTSNLVERAFVETITNRGLREKRMRNVEVIARLLVHAQDQFSGNSVSILRVVTWH
jgi:transposase-like protein